MSSCLLFCLVVKPEIAVGSRCFCPTSHPFNFFNLTIINRATLDGQAGGSGRAAPR